MASKRQFPLLTISGTDVVPVPPVRHTWSSHPSLKGDSFWDVIAKGFTEVGTPFKDKSSTSTSDSEGYQTLFLDDAKGKGMVIPPHSILRMRSNKGEVPLSEIRFVSRSHQKTKGRHEALTSFLQKTKYGATKKSTFLTWGLILPMVLATRVPIS